MFYILLLFAETKFYAPCILYSRKNLSLCQHCYQEEPSCATKGESFLNFAVTVLDKDSADVNDLVVRIEDDSLNLFAVKDTRMYGNLGNGKNTFFSAVIQSRSVLTFPEREYDFTVVIEDTSLLQKDRKVIYKISVVNETEGELKVERNV
ncbi:hypothetical protein TNIN_57901 [Trichonephila inaurata madagascariensis]|uniref:Uncharacterized protein n=1 Tax=Trichonephila inaurata madagascariensis TaxID=2747483 RepID=A0A8X7BXE3_9ARAC|nr:hypothetical protein TNIN_57901 [Trichonephila inaurata madagascariensis]